MYDDETLIAVLYFCCEHVWLSILICIQTKLILSYIYSDLCSVSMFSCPHRSVLHTAQSKHNTALASTLDLIILDNVNLHKPMATKIKYSQLYYFLLET